MLNRVKRWLGLGVDSAERGDLYAARDETIRRARRATNEQLVTMFEIANAEAVRRRGKTGYNAMLGVRAGIEKVMRERGLRRA